MAAPVTDANTGKGFGLYTYVDSNPYAKADPDGRNPEFSMYADPRAHLSQETRDGQDKATVIGTAVAVVAAPVAAEIAATVIAVGTETAATGSLTTGLLANAPAVNSAAIAGAELASGGVAGTVAVNAAQAKNVGRFMGKLPANAKGNVSLRELPGGGVAAQGTSTGKVPGSSAVYEKQIDSSGTTTQYTKTTYAPSGEIVHVKDRVTNEEFKSE